MQVPEDVLEAVERHGSSTFGNHRRRLLQPVQPNSLSVRPGQCSECKTGIWITSSLDPEKDSFSIPNTFLGISHEWTNLEEFYTKGGTYLQLIKDLTAYGGGPLVLRVGGGSTDKQTALPSQDTWKGLKQLQYATGEYLHRTCLQGAVVSVMYSMISSKYQVAFCQLLVWPPTKKYVLSAHRRGPGSIIDDLPRSWENSASVGP